MSSGWLGAAAARIAGRAEADTAALVAISSPSGDVAAAERAVEVAVGLAPEGVGTERLSCSSPDHAQDLLLTLSGSGSGRVLLLGHLDTVVSHEGHAPVRREGDRLLGSGTVDMKGGDAIALGLLRELAEVGESFAEVALLLVVDEEWRTAPFTHAERFAGWDACLCFEAGQRTPDGDEAVVVRRKAAGTLHVTAKGVAAHSGSAPDRGRNALVALSTAAQAVAAANDPSGPQHLTCVPTVMHAGDAFNVVPAAGELYCDLRADTLEAFDPVLESLPAEVGGATLTGELVRRWPGMDSEAAAAPLLSRASARLGSPIIASARGGASDASHMATTIPLSIDGLGPRGGGAHSPDEHLSLESLQPRAEIAAAIAAELLGIA